jgi:Methyltransferase domain
MNRIDIIQSLLDYRAGQTYLEIGLAQGESFLPIRATRKWGVDPHPMLGRKYSVMNQFSRILGFLGVNGERIFSMTSDIFFARESRALIKYGIDVCLVDGLHTYEQALRDIYNALAYLARGGVILVHDCNPSSELVARPASGIDEIIRLRIPGWDGQWSGDVWKAIVHLRSLRNDVQAFVLDCDTGVGIVTREETKELLPYSEADIRNMTYDFLAANRAALLDLRPREKFDEFLRKHALAAN